MMAENNRNLSPSFWSPEAEIKVSVQLYSSEDSRGEFTSYFFQLFFKWDWVLNSGLHICKASALLLEPHLQSLFSGYFRDRTLRTICLAWLQTTILPISASQVARVTGVSHWCPALPTLDGSRISGHIYALFSQCSLFYVPLTITLISGFRTGR
jgi:hypothetical protein